MANPTTSAASAAEPISLQRTLEQHRAHSAHTSLEAIMKAHPQETFLKEFKSRAQKLPTLILNNGLGATLGFLAAKGKNKPEKPETVLAEKLEAWLTGGIVKDLQVINWQQAQTGGLLERILQLDSETYRHVTMESLAWLTWLKRFVDGRIAGDDD